MFLTWFAARLMKWLCLISQDFLTIITSPSHTSLSMCTDVVPAPQNLKLSEVTQTSFRATWEHGAPDVALYRIGWTKKGENNFQYVR